MDLNPQLVVMVAVLNIVLILGFISQGFVDVHSIWYQSLRRPDWQPSPEVFMIMWLLIYALLLLNCWILIYSDKERTISKFAYAYIIGVIIFMGLNALWCYTFFQLHSFLGALIINVTMLALIAITIWMFTRLGMNIPIIMSIPIILWLCVAIIMTVSIMNDENVDNLKVPPPPTEVHLEGSTLKWLAGSGGEVRITSQLVCFRVHRGPWHYVDTNGPASSFQLPQDVTECGVASINAAGAGPFQLAEL